MLLFSNSETRGQGCERIQCLKFRMGCSLLKGENKGRWTPVEAHQLLVAFLAIYIYIYTYIQSILKTHECSHQVRQPHSHCLHKQDGSFCNDTTLYISTTDLAVVPGLVGLPLCQLSYREGEHNSRLGIPPS